MEYDDLKDYVRDRSTKKGRLVKNESEGEAFAGLNRWSHEDFLRISVRKVDEKDDRTWLRLVGEYFKKKKKKPNLFMMTLSSFEKTSKEIYVDIEELILKHVPEETLIGITFEEPEHLDKINNWLVKYPVSYVYFKDMRDKYSFDDWEQVFSGNHKLQIVHIEKKFNEKSLKQIVDYFSSSKIETILDSLWLSGLDKTPEIEEILLEGMKQSMINGCILQGIEVAFENRRWKNYIRDARLKNVKTQVQLLGGKMEIDKAIDVIFKKEKMIPFARTKLMVVGQNRAGKTSTIYSLLGKKFQKDMPSTLGVELNHVFDSEDNWEEESIDGREMLVEQISNAKVHELGENFKSVVNRNSPIKHQAVQKPEVELLEKRRNNTEYTRQKSTHKSSIEPSKRGEVIGMDKSKVLMYGEKVLKRRKNGSKVHYTVWDFGGQLMFYSLHHMFLTKRGFYLLVFDCNYFLKEERKSSEFLKFWLFCKKIHAGNARVFIVGTRINVYKYPDRAAKHISEKLEQLVIKKNVFDLVPNGDLIFFPIDNANGKGIRQLQERVKKVISGSEIVRTAVPVRYVDLYDMLLKKEGKYFQTKEIPKQFDMSQEDVDLALKFLNNRGLIIHVDAPKLKDIVILDPQWLIDALTLVIFDPSVHAVPKVSDEYRRDYTRYVSQGLLSDELLKDIWTQSGYSGDVQEILKEFMVFSLLMCRYRVSKRYKAIEPDKVNKQYKVNEPYKDDNKCEVNEPDKVNKKCKVNDPDKVKEINEVNGQSKVEERLEYLVPSMVDPGVQLREPGSIEEDLYSGPQFIFDFSGGYVTKRQVRRRLSVRYLPVGLFERFVCLCVTYSMELQYNLGVEVMHPEIQHNEVVLKFFESVVAKIEQTHDNQGEKLWIKVSLLTGTDYEHARKLVSLLDSMIKTLKEIFFPGDMLSYSLLLVPGDKNVVKAASYKAVKRRFFSESSATFFRPNFGVSSQQVRSNEFTLWFEDVGELAQSLSDPYREERTGLSLIKDSYVRNAKERYQCYVCSESQSKEKAEIVAQYWFLLSQLGIYRSISVNESHEDAWRTAIKQCHCSIFLFPLCSDASKKIKYAVSQGKKVLFWSHLEESGDEAFKKIVETLSIKEPIHFKLHEKYFKQEFQSRQILSLLSDKKW